MGDESDPTAAGDHCNHKEGISMKDLVTYRGAEYGNNGDAGKYRVSLSPTTSSNSLSVFF